MSKAADLPNDVEALKGIVLERNTALEAAEALVIAQKIELEKLRFEIACLKRVRYGRSSEQLDTKIGQMQLTLEDLEASLTERPAHVLPTPKEPPQKPVRRALPAHLPRQEIVHETPCTCPACGGALRRLWEDVSEMIEYVPGRYQVIRHVRPKLSCAECQKIVQAAAPSRPIARGLAGPAFLAHLLVSKHADHLPLYRQSQIYAREGLELERSTLAAWVGGASALLEPLVTSLGRYMGAYKLHGDDTPVPVLCPGRGTTKQGRLWTYVRDDRPAASTEPPAVLFRYSPDRKGERPKAHLAPFVGVLQADAYAGFDRLYAERIQEAACWAHVQRKFYEIHVAHASPIAAEALDRIGHLYGIEAEIRGRPPDERTRIRQARAGPGLEALHTWLHTTLTTLSKKSELAVAIRYALSRWAALTRYRDDGRLEIDNNAAERALRAVALGRKNWLFAGSDDGGERAATIYSLLGSAKLNDLNPEAYLRYVRERIAEHPIQSHRGVAAVERRSERAARGKSRRVAKRTPPKALPPSASPSVVPPFQNIEWLIAGGGDITLGRMGPFPCAATAADEDICYAMLVRRKGETLLEFLQRLDQSVELASEDHVTIDEVNSPSPQPSIRR